MGRWGIIAGASPTDIPHLFRAFYIAYRMNKNYFAPGANYYDHHKDITINVNGANPTDLLRAALAEDVEPIREEQPAPKEYCEYICREKLQEQGLYTLDEFESMMANASKGIASDFAAFLKRYKAQGILNFMGHSKKQIFDNFRAHYPEMRAYEYPNFAAAF